MNIDERDIEKGPLADILPEFHPNSISYLSELNDYRMYAEIWSNKRSKANAKRAEIGRTGYMKTLEFGERKKKRKSDKVRFDYFIVANSLNYMTEKNIYGEPIPYVQIGGVETNTIFNNIFKAKTRSQNQLPDTESDFHTEGYLPGTIESDLAALDLSKDEKQKKYYFEIPTDSVSISNRHQEEILSLVLGKDDFFQKLQLLYKVDRKKIRCFFENPENVVKNIGASNSIPRLCVAWPFMETLVFDFAGIPEEYSEACLLGTLIKTKEGQPESEEHLDRPQIDSYV